MTTNLYVNAKKQLIM